MTVQITQQTRVGSLKCGVLFGRNVRTFLNPALSRPMYRSFFVMLTGWNISIGCHLCQHAIERTEQRIFWT